MADQDDWSDFTETAFRGHLQALQDLGYRFIRFGEQPEGRQVIWRHDVDWSIHRAASLARIEAEAGVTATYFINPRSIGYSLAEPAVVQIARRIAADGHEIGLHFDPEAYGLGGWTVQRLEEAVGREKRLIEMLLDLPVRVMSWHNPTLTNLLDFAEDEVCGMVNAYGRTYRSGYVYASDSNGMWRHQPMAQVIAAGHERLQLLTHPEWWAPEALPPAERLERCLQGRAVAGARSYHDALVLDGRFDVLGQ
jgi:hypothetical protein